MNGYLVLARCGMDDIPMALFGTREDAMNHALSVTEDDVIQAAAALGVGVSYVIAIAIIPFIGGVAQFITFVKNMEDIEAPDLPPGYDAVPKDDPARQVEEEMDAAIPPIVSGC